MNPTTPSWRRAWSALGLQAPPGLQAALLQAYGERIATTTASSTCRNASPISMQRAPWPNTLVRWN
ncbi:MAG: hypothetical protein ACT4NV_20270 [Rhodoferax sp.]